MQAWTYTGTIRDYFVNQYDAARYVTSADGRDNRHIQFVREFASVVSILQDKTNSVIDLYKDILRAVEDFATCPLPVKCSRNCWLRYRLLWVGRGIANLEHWVAELNKGIEGVLLRRLVQIIKVRCAEFDCAYDGDTWRDAPIRETFSKWRGG